MKFIPGLTNRQKNFIKLISVFCLNKNTVMEIKEGNITLPGFISHVLAYAPIEEQKDILNIIIKRQGKFPTGSDQKKLSGMSLCNKKTVSNLKEKLWLK